MPKFEIDQDIVEASMLSQLRRYDVAPILKQLARMLECPPDVESMQDWSNRHPDRWAAAVSTLARLGGFTERREVDVSVTIDLSRLSDSQLLSRLKAGMASLHDGSVIDAAVLPDAVLPAVLPVE